MQRSRYILDPLVKDYVLVGSDRSTWHAVRAASCAASEPLVKQL